MKTLIYTTGAPVLTGDVVHIKNQAYTVHDFDRQSGYVYVKSMGESRYFKPVFPSMIGARIINEVQLEGV